MKAKPEEVRVLGSLPRGLPDGEVSVSREPIDPWVTTSANPIPDKRGYAVLSLDFLRSILRLPEGVKVKWVLMDPSYHQCRLYLEGPGLPSGCIVPEGDSLPVVALLCSAYAPTRIVA